MLLNMELCEQISGGSPATNHTCWGIESAYFFQSSSSIPEMTENELDASDETASPAVSKSDESINERIKFAEVGTGRLQERMVEEEAFNGITNEG